MPLITSWMLILSGASFVAYGISCLLSGNMKSEFRRFGLARFRLLVGWLEIAGGGAQLAHSILPQVSLTATAGIFLLMLLGVIVRIRTGDRLWVTLPALGFMALNGWLLFMLIQR